MDKEHAQIHQFAGHVLGLRLSPLHERFSPISRITQGRMLAIQSQPTTPSQYFKYHSRYPRRKDTSQTVSFKSQQNFHRRSSTEVKSILKKVLKKPQVQVDFHSDKASVASAVSSPDNVRKADQESPTATGEKSPPFRLPIPTRELPQPTTEQRHKAITMMKTRKLATMTVIAPVVEGRTLRTERERTERKREDGL